MPHIELIQDECRQLKVRRGGEGLGQCLSICLARVGVLGSISSTKNEKKERTKRVSLGLSWYDACFILNKAAFSLLKLFVAVVFLIVNELISSFICVQVINK